jgi:hypothetical protein
VYQKEATRKVIAMSEVEQEPSREKSKELRAPMIERAMLNRFVGWNKSDDLDRIACAGADASVN